MTPPDSIRSKKNRTLVAWGSNNWRKKNQVANATSKIDKIRFFKKTSHLDPLEHAIITRKPIPDKHLKVLHDSI
jgi:hypothetical protein